jgi:alpha-D-xyloside xylohydrolase
VFKEQLSSLLSFSASGIPFSTTDIGAFFVDYKDGNQNREYRELYTRWFWFGAFCPLFRSHGTSTPREMWFFGEPGTEYFDAQMAASKLRYTLMPYIYANAFKTYAEDYTLMRPLVMDFPEDKSAKDIFDSYMFGDSLLVHIVTEPDRREEKVYLPGKCQWVHYFTGERYAGGQTVTVVAPINQTPLFVKAGSIIVTTEPAECTAWQDEKELEINVYTGADATAFYYWDDGDNYTYEQGNYIKIPFEWEQHSNRLIIGEVIGEKECFDIRKTLNIYIDGKWQKNISYEGKEIQLSF